MRHKVWHLALPVVLIIVSLPTGVALAGDCDGTATDDPITCSSDPSAPDAVVGLGLGNDTYTQESGVTSDSVSGDGLEDGTESVGNGGNDTITINGTVLLCVDGDNVDGDGGNDTIIINGEVDCQVSGDYATGNGGDDKIIINGEVDSDVSGDQADLDGGDDSITINGHVGGHVYGDNVSGDGGSDVIIINGTVDGDVYGDDLAAGGDDNVILGAGAQVAGTLYGDDGYDLLQFTFLTQDQLAGLDPQSGTISYGVYTFTWEDFEELIGLLQEAGVRILFANGSTFAAVQEDGIAIFAEHGRIAYVDFDVIAAMNTGAVLTLATPNAAGWYVTVTDLGANSEHTANTLFQVNIYDAGGTLVGQFYFAN